MEVTKGLEIVEEIKSNMQISLGKLEQLRQQFNIQVEAEKIAKLPDKKNEKAD